MFEEMSKPPKGKGKEKDIGKRRAYARVVTSLGGSLNLELFCEKVRDTELIGRMVKLIPSYSGTQNLLQLPYACTAGEVQRLLIPSLSARVHGTSIRPFVAFCLPMPHV